MRCRGREGEFAVVGDCLRLLAVVGGGLGDGETGSLRLLAIVGGGFGRRGGCWVPALDKVRAVTRVGV